MANSNALSEKIGARIRNIRIEQGITGKRLAQLSNISPTFLSEVERGLSKISSEKLLRIAEALGVNIQTLINPETESKKSTDSVEIPIALSEAAEDLDLTYSQTIRILDGAMSLTARRSSGVQEIWSKQRWIEFYEKVKFILEE